MGLMKWFARKGAIGSVTRWVAKTYLKLKRTNPYLSDQEIFALMTDARYSFMMSEEKKQLAINRSRKASGLFSLTTIILDTESAFSSCDSKTIKLFNEVIIEELDKCNIPESLLR